ncbi:helix-turn-helix domain-containing protein [Hoeflea poritis]|uniref:Type II toxin-antitoxin system MqsA family antitoxin n=1 Tax=Hoeflea poritis TaxID=2993659 RepID=A0ABT4VTK1_9HYPH|nr:type II toxin-antitoxin system MqsA family antitoxin [Hoeflea poritis]MDA4848021.1 type II toxin-antitoxin system MqsA family antitoxin [Hoeflea poritis]
MTKFGDDLIQAMSEALAHTRGEDVPGAVVHEIDTNNIDPRAIRDTLDLTQEQMARLFGISLSGYKKWEQGERAVPGPARQLMRVVQKEPEAALRALLAG